MNMKVRIKQLCVAEVQLGQQYISVKLFLITCLIFIKFFKLRGMRNVTNYAEESPFIDMTHKSQTKNTFDLSQQSKEMNRKGEQMKKNQPQPDFRIYKPTLKYNYEEVNVPNQEHNQIIGKIIEVVEKGIMKNLEPQSNNQLKQLIKNNKEMIQGYIKLGYPSCIFIGVVASNLQTCFNADFPIQKYKNIKQLKVKHKNYPPLLTVIAKQLFLTSSEKWKQYLNKAAIEYGYAFAFVEYGILLDLQEDKIKAFEMFKNAEHLGLVGIASLYLGKICYQGGLRVNMNLYRSLYYYRISEGLDVKFDKKNQIFYNHTKSLYDHASYSDKEVITTEQTEALVVSRFLQFKFQEKQSFKNKSDLNYYVKTQAGKGLNAVFSTKSRVFYVVCSPYLVVPSRGFLAEEKDTGFIEIINIYNWQKISIEKLKLLHKQGTKVTLRSYLRKLADHHRTPMYRVQDPTSVNIEPTSQRKIISQSKYRNMGKLLFGSGHFDLALAVYRVLEERGCSQLEIVFSNAGLCHQKLNNYNEAMNFYKKSLGVKKYQKSQIRLASLHFKRKQFDQANKIIMGMDESKLKSEMVQRLNEQIDKQIEKTNLQFITFLKSKKRTAKMTPYIEDSKRQTLGWKQLQYGFRIHREQFETIIKTTFTSDQQYIKKIKYLIIDFIDIPQSQISSKNPDIATFFQLTSFTKIFAYIVRSAIQPRQRKMMNRIQNYCQEREIDGDIQQAIDMLKIVAPRSLIMTIKLAQLLRKQNKINESIQACKQYLQSWFNDDLDFNFEYYYASLNLQLIKSEIKAKKFSLKKCKQYLQKINNKGQEQKKVIIEIQSYIDQYNFDFRKLLDGEQMGLQLNKFHRVYTLKQINQYLSKLNWNPLSIKQQIYLQISIALGKQRKFDDAFKYLSQIIVNHARKIHPADVYYRAVIFRILLLQDNGQINESIVETDRIIKILKRNQKEVENYKAFRKTLLQQKISSYLKQKNHEKIVKICEEIIQFSLQNCEYVVKKLSTFIFEDRSVLAGKLLKQVQNSSVISFLFDELQTKLQISTSSEQQMLQIFEKSINQKVKIIKTKNNIELIYQIPEKQNLIEASKEYENFKKNKQTGMDKFLEELQEYEDMQRDLQYGFEGIEGLIMHFYHQDNYQHYAIILSPKLEQSHQQLKQFYKVTNRLFTEKENQDQLINLGNKTIKIIMSNSQYVGSMKKKSGVYCCVFDKCSTN